MFEDYNALWMLMQQAAGKPDGAAMLSQLGDPDAVMAPLFKDTQQWSPLSNIASSDPMTPTPALGGENSGFNIKAPTVPMQGAQLPPPIPQNGAAMPPETPPVDAAAATSPQMTPEMYKQLMGAMPDQRGYVPPAPGIPRSGQFNGKISPLQAQTNMAGQRMTLADLIFGGR